MRRIRAIEKSIEAGAINRQYISERVDKISLQQENLAASVREAQTQQEKTLRDFAEKLAYENTDILKKLETVDTFQKRQNHRLKKLENGGSENIF